MFGNKRNGGGSPSGLPQLTRIELTQKNLALRIVLLVLAILLAIFAFGYGISTFFGSESGWREIETNTGDLDCSQDFELWYKLGASGGSATAENKQLVTLYNQASRDAYRIFNNEYTEEDVLNIYYVNQHVNQEILIDPALYKAFSVIVAAENRSIFLAPVYREYANLFTSTNEEEAKLFDPTRNPEQAAYIQEIMAFVSDQTKISLELLGENKVRLNVSQDYLTFAQENEQELFLDFSWMKNAFIADYLADTLITNGYTYGYITSYDGFTRNLCPEEEQFRLNVFQLVDKSVVRPGVLKYSGGNALVTLRAFPMANADAWNYFVFSDGRIASLQIDPSTGLEKQAVNNLTGYSKTAGCGEILMALLPVYLADELDVPALKALDGITTVYAQGETVYCSDASANLILEEGQNYTRTDF